MSNFSGLILIALAQLITTGMNSATTGVLLMKADKNATLNNIQITPNQKFLRNNFRGML